MRAAEEQLLLGFELAARFRHKGLRGSSREEVVADFLSDQIPSRFGVTAGEAIDAAGGRTGQLDIVVFDRYATAPLLKRDAGDLLPAEALLAVIEVKPMLSQKDLNMAAAAARRISELRPFGEPFVPARQDGAEYEGRCRCQYSVVAFKSNLGEANWPTKEWERLTKAATKAEIGTERIDRVLVLDRGMLVPPTKSAKQKAGESEVLLRHWFLHMINFVQREAARRQRFDFERSADSQRTPGGFNCLSTTSCGSRCTATRHGASGSGPRVKQGLVASLAGGEPCFAFVRMLVRPPNLAKCLDQG